MNGPEFDLVVGELAKLAEVFESMLLTRCALLLEGVLLMLVSMSVWALVRPAVSAALGGSSQHRVAVAAGP